MRAAPRQLHQGVAMRNHRSAMVVLSVLGILLLSAFMGAQGQGKFIRIGRTHRTTVMTPAPRNVLGKISFARVNDSTLVASCKPAAGDPPCDPFWFTTESYTEVYIVGGKTARMLHLTGGEDDHDGWTCVQWSPSHSVPRWCRKTK